VTTFSDTYLEEDIAVLGRKGGGKTYTSKGLVERLLDMGRRVLILDPLGVWAGLRTGADGCSAGYPVAIFGGQHGDLPLEPAAAVPIADVIARNNVPAVLDISELSKTAQQSFLLAFLRELRRVNTEALTLVLEEADVFAPQNPMGDDSKALHSEIDWICRRGRFRGFRLITITQRPARLSKDVLTQAATLIMHRLPAPQDRDAVKAWVDGNGDRDQAKEVFDTLARLDTGEAWVWSTVDNALSRTRFPRIKTLDTSATPKAGEKRIAPKTLAQVDLGPIRAALAEAAVAAAAEKGARGRSPSGGSGGQPAAPTPELIAAAEQRGRDAGFADGYALATTEWREQFGQIDACLRDVFGRLMSGAPGRSEPAAAVRPRDTSLPASPAPKASPRPARQQSDGSLSGAATALLEAIQRYPDGLTWDDACIVAAMLPGNGYFYRGKKDLMEGGHVSERDGKVVAKRGAGSGDPLGLSEIVTQWSGKVGAPGGPMLAYLAKRRGAWVDTDELSAAINAKPGNGYWYRGVKSIRKANLIEQESGRFRISTFLREAP